MLTLKIMLLSFSLLILGSILGHNGIVLPAVMLIAVGMEGFIMAPLISLMIKQDM